GRCIADAASLFNGFMLYDLPFGKGRRFGGGAEGILNAVIGGWSIAPDSLCIAALLFIPAAQTIPARAAFLPARTASQVSPSKATDSSPILTLPVASLAFNS